MRIYQPHLPLQIHLTAVPKLASYCLTSWAIMPLAKIVPPSWYITGALLWNTESPFRYVCSNKFVVSETGAMFYSTSQEKCGTKAATIATMSIDWVANCLMLHLPVFIPENAPYFTRTFERDIGSLPC